MLLTHKKKGGREQEIRVSTRVKPSPWKIGRKLLHRLNENKKKWIEKNVRPEIPFPQITLQGTQQYTANFPLSHRFLQDELTWIPSH